MLEDKLELGLTFDDVLLMPLGSDVLPKDANVSTTLARDIRLNIPIVSAAMDTVTEWRTAVAMAQEGGIGFIHRNLPIHAQAREVEKVKKSESGMISDPITVRPDQRIDQALELMRQHGISGLPVTSGSKLVGILTNRDLRFEKRLDRQVSDVMTKHNLVTARPGIGLEEAKEILHQHRIEKLLVVDDEANLKGLITVKDIDKAIQYPQACKDQQGRLRVGGAAGVGPDRAERVEALVRAGVDAITIDTAHGQSKNVLDAIREIRHDYPDIALIGGNVATGEGALALVKAGADAIKVGVGPGSICTTRVISGVGVPQVSAIMACREVAKQHGVQLISDGGIKYSGDITKAIAAGAMSVMIGSLLAGTEESPGETILYQGRTYKQYRGMGSLAAMRAGSSDRYLQEENGSESKMVPEGVEGQVPYKGTLSLTIQQLVGGLKVGMGYLGCRTLEDLQMRARFLRVTAAGLKESHVHDVFITKEAPNYRLE